MGSRLVGAVGLVLGILVVPPGTSIWMAQDAKPVPFSTPDALVSSTGSRGK